MIKHGPNVAIKYDIEEVEKIRANDLHYDRQDISFMQQRTLKKAVRILYQENDTLQSIVLKPAPPNIGIVFRRIDLDPILEIPAQIKFAEIVSGQIILRRNRIMIQGVEHLLSALYGLNISNAYIDMTREIVPILDQGSTEPFVFLLKTVGYQIQNALRYSIRLKKKVTAAWGNICITFSPDDAFRLKSTFSHNHSSSSECEILFSSHAYTKELSRAREMTWYGNAKPRYHNEIARHFLIDTIGYFCLLGVDFIGSLQSREGNLNVLHRLMQRVFSTPNTWEYTTRTDHLSLAQPHLILNTL